MERNRTDEHEYARIASGLGVSCSDVKSAVASFFDAIARDAKRLPFDNPRRIYKSDKFHEYGHVWSLPCLGRLGPSYSRYLQWRANVSSGIEFARRSDYRTVYTSADTESLAYYALYGWKPGDPPIKGRMLDSGKKSKAYPFKRVWLVGADGKKQATQVIPKEKCSKSKK